MSLAVKPFLRLAVPVVAAVCVALAWQASSVGASHPSSAATKASVAPSVQTRVVEDTAGLAALSQQVAALQQSVTQTDQDMAAQMATLKGTITALQGSVATLQKGLASAQGADASQATKVANLSATVTSMNQLLTALQAQFNAELRKLAGSPSP